MLNTSYHVTNQLPHHAIQEVEGAEADGFVLVIKTLQYEVLVGLHTLGMSLEDLGHRHQTQVLHCTST